MEKRPLETHEMGINPQSYVKVTTMNHIVEIQYLEKQNSTSFIRKLDADHYTDIRTGEIREIRHTENRSQGINSLQKTFNRLRELINTNFVGSPNELFVTLTYRGELQTNDTKRIYEDFKNFMKRLKYAYKKSTTIDYINVLEPHASGNFHMHVLLRFNDVDRVDYIRNDYLRDMWGHGFVTIQSLKGVDNIGAYLSAYLADIEIPEDRLDNLSGHPDLIEKDVKGKKKKFLKGARLVFYPTGVNIYRKSKGIRDAEKEKMSYKNAQKKVGSVKPHFKYGVELIDNENDFRNTLIKEQYNLKRH